MPRQGKLVRRHDALAIVVVWAVSVWLSLFVVPHTGYASIHELLYYAFYNVSVGWFIGFHLFDRLPRHGFGVFAITASSMLLFGTLVNESIVEPVIFATGPINGEGFYYGIADSLWTAAAFLLFRFAERQHLIERRGRAEAERRACPVASRTSSAANDAEAACLFVKVAGGTRRIDPRDILYLEAERDFARIVCANGEHFVSESLKSLLSRSAAFGLVRVHKSFAVNLGRVERLTRTEAQLESCRVPVGRRYWPALAEAWRARAASPATF